YKVSGTWPDKYRTTVMLMIGGIDAARKGEAVAENILHKVSDLFKARDYTPFERTNVEILGSEATYGPHSRMRQSREVMAKIAAVHADRDARKLRTRGIAQAATAMAPGMTGFFGGRAGVTPIIRRFSCL